MVSLLLLATRGSGGLMASVGAVDMPAVARAAEMKQPPAVIESAENLPEIVHSRARPPGTRPLRRTRATTLSSNASTRGDPGLGGASSGPYSLVRSPGSSGVTADGANYVAAAARSDFRGFRWLLTP